MIALLLPFIAMSVSTMASPSCESLLNLKPSFEALRALQERNLMGSLKEEMALADRFLDIYLESPDQISKQLMRSQRMIMEKREQAAKRMKDRIERENPFVFADDQMVEKIRTEAEFSVYDEILMLQILKFKNAYFSNSFEMEFNPEGSTTESFIFAVPRPQKSLGYFQIKLLVGGKPYVLDFHPDTPFDKIEAANLVLVPISPPPEFTLEYPVVDPNGRPLQFYWAYLVH